MPIPRSRTSYTLLMFFLTQYQYLSLTNPSKKEKSKTPVKHRFNKNKNTIRSSIIRSIFPKRNRETKRKHALARRSRLSTTSYSSQVKSCPSQSVIVKQSPCLADRSSRAPIASLPVSLPMHLDQSPQLDKCESRRGESVHDSRKNRHHPEID